MTTDLTAKLTEMLEQERKMTPVNAGDALGYGLRMDGRWRHRTDVDFVASAGLSDEELLLRYTHHLEDQNRRNIKPLAEFALAVERALFAKFPIDEIRSAREQLEKDLA